MELAAARRAVREQALEELHGRGHHDGGVPVLHGVMQLLPCLRDVTGALYVLAVVLQHCLWAQRPQSVTENSGVLLHDARKGDDVDDPLQAVLDGVVQGESQGGKGLATTGGDREGEVAWGFTGSAAYGV